MPIILRAVSEGEWLEIKCTGSIPPSGEMWRPYPKDAPSYFIDGGVPFCTLLSAVQDLYDEGASIVHLIGIEVSPWLDDAFRPEPSSDGDGRLVHRGPLEASDEVRITHVAAFTAPGVVRA